MTDRPILFSASMVRAIIREIEQPGTGKTQTRRVADFEGIDKVVDFVRVAFDRESGVPIYEMKDASGRHVYRPAGKDMQTPHWSPRYAVGDRLWVREAWRVSWRWDDTPPRDLPERKMSVVLEAGGSIANHGDPLRWIPSDWPGAGMPEWIGRLRPGIHMPRWASRLTLTVTDVRVQRLQDISEEDALEEGIECWSEPGLCSWRVGDAMSFTGAVDAYHLLWDSINADRAPWDSNPWVVAVTFTSALGNIDQVRP